MMAKSMKRLGAAAYGKKPQNHTVLRSYASYWEPSKKAKAKANRKRK